MRGTDSNPQAEKARTSKLAIASAVVAFSGVFVSLCMTREIVNLVAGYLAWETAVTVVAAAVMFSLAIILGVGALSKIRKVGKILQGWGIAITGIIVSTIGLVLVVLLFVRAPFIHRAGQELGLRIRCQNNLRTIGMALECYTWANNESFPTAGEWCDLLVQGEYISTDSRPFVCGRGREGPCYYAINPNAKPTSPADMVLLFDTNSGWNQYGGPEILTTLNHYGKGCNILFCDGHVEFVKCNRLGQLMWQDPGIHGAAIEGNLDKLKAILAEKPKLLEMKDALGRTPLYLAALEGHKNTMEYLIAKRAKVNAKNRKGETPLHAAASNGHNGVVEYLLGTGTKAYVTDFDGCTPLHCAAEGGHTATVELLLARGANVNARDRHGCMPLHDAARSGHRDTIEFLIRRGANVSMKDYGGRTALHWAAAWGHKDAVEFLISEGAELNARDKEGRTPLRDAVRCCQGKEVAELLRKYGAVE